MVRHVSVTDECPGCDCGRQRDVAEPHHGVQVPGIASQDLSELRFRLRDLAVIAEVGERGEVLELDPKELLGARAVDHASQPGQQHDRARVRLAHDAAEVSKPCVDYPSWWIITKS